MARVRSVYACSACGAQQPRWLGRCPDCGRWETLVEETLRPTPAAGAVATGGPRALGEIEPLAIPRLGSGLREFDRVLGGGFVPGSVVLLGGAPGVGKSTLALQAAAKVERAGECVFYVSGEESAEQLRLRADRLEDVPASLRVLAETSVEAIERCWQTLQPRLVLIDSVQTMRSQRAESASGSVAQVRESAAALAAVAKKSAAVLLLIGHVTKEGLLAGPRVLEHLVDVVLSFEGDRDHAFRLLRASKNRFGSTQEVGVFSMGGAGLTQVDNPSELFLAERSDSSAGSCVVPVLEGSRPMLVEIQALVSPAPYGTPRRTCMGIEDGRVALLLAVLDRRSDVDLLGRDVYVNVAGGVKVGEPAADLALCLAIASSRLDIPLPADAAICGEVGLGGEVRRVARLDLRLREASRLGFRRLLVPAAAQVELPTGTVCELVPIANLADAVVWLRSSSSVHTP